MIVREIFAKLGLKTDKASFTSAEHMMKRVKQGLVAIGAYKAFGWIKGMINDVRESADNYNKMAKSVGITSEALQQLEYAAQIGGTNLNVLRTGLQRFGRNAYDATHGVAKAADGFKQLGVKVKDASGNLRNGDDLLMEVAEKFKGMPDGTKKTAVAMEVFGRAGALMIPMLNEGRDGIQKLRDEFVDLGGQIDTATGAQFEALNDDVLRMNTVLRSVKNQIVIALLPTLRRMAQSMAVWAKANRKVIAERVATFLRGLIFILRMLAKTIAFVIDNWKILTIAFASWVAASKITAIIGALKALAVAAQTTMLRTAAAWLIGMAPLVLLALAIGAVILIIEDLWVALTGGDSALKRLHAFLVDKMVAAMEAWDRAIKKVKHGMDLLIHGEEFGYAIKHRTGAAIERGEMAQMQKKRDDQLDMMERRIEIADMLAQGFNPAFGPAPAVGKAAPNLTANVTVNAQTGASADEIGQAVEKHVGSVLLGTWREADAALGD